MEIEFTEYRELLPATDETESFWHRVLVGRFEHDDQHYAVTASLADEELTPERRGAWERMLKLEAARLIGEPVVSD